MTLATDPEPTVLPAVPRGRSLWQDAWRRLRSVAMDWGMTIEDAADAICRNEKRTRSGA